VIIVPVEKKVDWKRPPIVLILIVAINILVFAFYQSGDQKLLSKAVQTYHQKGLLEKEWVAFKAYSRRNDLPFELDTIDFDYTWYLVSDSGFDQFIQKHHRNYISARDYPRWRKARDRVERSSSRISANAFGLDASNVQPLQLITHQFLHGGIMHILGNMVFLVLTGFAVEAALGSLRFLGFYLLAGVGGGLLFALFEPMSASLVGASGAISGVMAMYVVLFQMRKIQFFYWFFIFTGYIKAAAIVMLPFYVGFEVYKYFSNDGSNVAYTAHIGGFLVGAALVFITQNVNKSGIDEQYIDGEGDQADPFAHSLSKLYGVVAQCDFKRAWTMLKPLKAKHPNRPILIEIEYNLVRALHPSKLDDYLLHRMDKVGNSAALIRAQMAAWMELKPEQRSGIRFSKKSALLQNALDHDALLVAENIFSDIRSEINDNLEMAVLANRMASYYAASKNEAKSTEYQTLVSQLTQPKVNAIDGVS